MFMKQYNYKPRSNSQSSSGSGSGTTAAASSPKAEEKTTATAQTAQNTGGAVSGAIAGRRRSSASAEKFAGLNAHKRNSSDENSAARKASWAEQKSGQTGILGGMWNSFTKGS